MKTRFAPSPTGYLHLGNLRTALLCFLYARKAGGEFILRLDDTDLERSRQEYADAILEDLTWLGIPPDAVVKQSDHFAQYDAAVAKLKETGRLYPCYETKQELDFKRKVQLSQGRPPIYDRAALKLSDAQKQKLESEGHIPHWRFKLDENRVVEWQDEVRGAQRFEMTHMSDTILVRENGMYTYMLPSTVDDINMGITHVLRGEDHVSNTAIQIQLFHALSGNEPKFAHNALLKSKEGKLSKRAGSQGIRDLREKGIEPLTLLSFLARVGTGHAVGLADSVDQLVREFEIHAYGKAQTSYSMEDIERLNTKLLHRAPLSAVKAELEEMGLPNVDEAFWEVAKHNIESLEEVKLWWHICKEEVEVKIADEDREFIAKAVEVLPAGEITENTWDQWLSEIKKVTDRKGKGLFMPLRKALTGMEHGPELKDLLPLMGRERVVSRLRGEVA